MSVLGASVQPAEAVLPVEAAMPAEAAPPVEATAPAPSDRRALRIMIVEDTPGDAELTAEMLSRHRPAPRVTTFAGIEDATPVLAGSTTDCVLLDLGLPAADALEGLNRIFAVAPGVPVVVLTGRDDDRLAVAAVGRGAQDYLTKRNLEAAPLWRVINQAIERARVTRELTRRATHDALTGLPNSAHFSELVDQAIARSRRSSIGFGVMLIAIDGFKTINDNFGHAVGDEVLREISRRLVRGLREGDTPCRYAGVEFAAICHVADRPEAALAATRIHDSVCREPVVVGVRSLNVGAWVGVALGSGDDTAATLLHRVDGAVYEARLTAAGCVVD
jgi:diguanylate cyclase (GGDEF)-like protein